MKNYPGNWSRLAGLAIMIVCMYFSNRGMAQSAVAAQTGQQADPSVMEDTLFIARSIQDIRTDIRLARMAMHKGESLPVKNLAEQMIKDQMQMLYELKSAARSYNMAETDGKADPDMTGDTWQSATGHLFDAGWIAHMLGVYENKLNELTAVSRYDESPEIRTMVKKAIPIVRRNRDVLYRMNRQSTIQAYSSRN